MSTLSHEKKGRLLMLLKILEDHSGKEKGLTQQKIIDYLKNEYDIEVERKAISDDITFLMELSEMFPSKFDFEIRSDRKNGVAMISRKFDDSELQLLIDAVVSSKNIPEKQIKELCNRLSSLSNEYFRSSVNKISIVKDVLKIKTANLFSNIDILCEAIQSKQKVRIDYGKYGADLKLTKSSTYEISPYRLIFHNQKYYVIGFREDKNGIIATRVDHIMNLTVLENSKKGSQDSNNLYRDIKTIKGYENGFDMSKLSPLPYLFLGATERIVFLVKEEFLDDCIEWFGKNANITKVDSDSKWAYKVDLSSSPRAMEYWFMQYINAVKIVSPKSLKEKIKLNLENALKEIEA